MILNFDIAPITTTDMEGNETRDSKQCKCHVGGGPGGWGGGLVTKSKRRF